MYKYEWNRGPETRYEDNRNPQYGDCICILFVWKLLINKKYKI